VHRAAKKRSGDNRESSGVGVLIQRILPLRAAASGEGQ